MDLLTANDRPGEHPASWYAATAAPAARHPALADETRADVCVVGGGYTGLSAALHLAEAGLDVVLLEAHRLGWGASGRNGGQLGSGQRQDQGWIARHYGRDRARMLWDMAEEAKALVGDRIARHGIDCDLRPGIIYAAHRRRLLPVFRAEAEALARDYGYDQLDFLDRAEIEARVATRTYHGGLLDRGAAHLHPLNLALGFARAAAEAGARLFEGSRAIRFEPGDPATVSTDAGRVRARFVVLAGNGYLDGLAPDVTARVMPINNFIAATAPLEVPEALIRDRLAVSDSRFVVRYFRMSGDGRLLFGGGESYHLRFPRDIAGMVRPKMLEIFPQLGETRIDYAWGGTLAITVSRMPALQRLAPNAFSAGGYSGHGVGLAVFAGKLMAEAVQGTAGHFDVFAGLPQHRFPGGKAMRSPLLALAMTWYALLDRL